MSNAVVTMVTHPFAFFGLCERQGGAERKASDRERTFISRKHTNANHMRPQSRRASPLQEDRTCVPVWLEVVWVPFRGYYGFARCNRIVTEEEQLVWCWREDPGRGCFYIRLGLHQRSKVTLILLHLHSDDWTVTDLFICHYFCSVDKCSVLSSCFSYIVRINGL